MKLHAFLIPLLFISFLHAVEPQPDDASLIQQLDRGGERFEIVRGAYERQTLKPSFDLFADMLLLKYNREAESVAGSERLKTLPQRMGLGEIFARGSSTIRLQGNGYLTKHVLQKASGATGWIWQLPGKEVNLKKMIQQLPASTVQAVYFSANATLLYQQITQEAPAFPAGNQAWESLVAELKQLEFPLEQLCESLEEGISLGLTFNQASRWKIAVGNRDHEIPETGFVMRLSDPKGDLLAFVIQQLEKDEIMNDLALAGIVIKSLSLPVELETPVSLNMVNLNGVTLVATSPALMQELIERQRSPQNSPLEAELNHLQDPHVFMGSVTHADFNAEYSKLIDIHFDSMHSAFRGSNYAAQTYRNKVATRIPEVVLLQTHEDFIKLTLQHQEPLPKQDMGYAKFFHPFSVGLMTAQTLSKKISPRKKANDRTCFNHLRLIEAATDQWAIENNMPGGALPFEADIAPYIKNGMPQCPAGGIYSLNSVDEYPGCSIHGRLENFRR